MSALRIRVYKVRFPDGSSGFEFKKEDEEGAGGTGSLQLMAKLVKRDVVDFLGDEDDPLNARKVDPFGQVFVDFQPQHDIECRQHLAPRRCVPLTEEERDVFWNAFNKN